MCHTPPPFGGIPPCHNDIGVRTCEAKLMFERSLTMLFTTGGVSICTRKGAAREFVVDRRDGKWYDPCTFTSAHHAKGET